MLTQEIIFMSGRDFQDNVERLSGLMQTREQELGRIGEIEEYRSGVSWRE